MMRLAILFAIGIVLIGPVRVLLVRVRWTAYAPRVAIALWQATALAFGIAIIGACWRLAALASPGANPRRHLSDFTGSLVANSPSRSSTPEQLFCWTAVLIVATLLLGMVVSRTITVMRVRAHQRTLIDLLADENAKVPGALVLDHPTTTAFSLPGLRPRIVVSRRALEVLSADELAAVLAHERSHTRARHDLVLLPFRSLGTVLPRSRALAAVNRTVEALVEMAADDRAVRECGPGALTRALCAMGTMATDATTPITSDMAGAGANRRIERLLAPRPNAAALVIGSSLSALVILALPLVTLFMALGRG